MLGKMLAELGQKRSSTSAGCAAAHRATHGNLNLPFDFVGSQHNLNLSLACTLTLLGTAKDELEWFVENRTFGPCRIILDMLDQ
jgi:hypothetical protein